MFLSFLYISTYLTYSIFKWMSSNMGTSYFLAYCFFAMWSPSYCPLCTPTFTFIYSQHHHPHMWGTKPFFLCSFFNVTRCCHVSIKIISSNLLSPRFQPVLSSLYLNTHFFLYSFCTLVIFSPACVMSLPVSSFLYPKC